MNIFEGLDAGGPAFFRNDVYVYGRFFAAKSIALPYVGKTGAYTLTDSDSVVDITAGTFTVSLPTAVGISGRIYTIKNSGTGSVTVDGAGAETIDGAATAVLRPRYSCITIQSNGANWIVIGCISPVQMI